MCSDRLKRRCDDLVLQTSRHHLEDLKFPLGQLAHLIETGLCRIRWQVSLLGVVRGS